MKIVKKRLPRYVIEPSKDCSGYSIAELYCSEDGADWGYVSMKEVYFKTEEEANVEVKHLMEDTCPNSYFEVNWTVE